MLRRGLVKCSSLFFIIFLMCPRRIHPTAPIKQDKFHALKRTPKDVLDINVNFGNDHSSNILRDNVNENLLDSDYEPGFDLCDDEIKKFKLWPKGIIPYYIDVVSFNDKVLRDRIRTFLNAVQSLTKLSFLEMPTPPKDDMTRWVFFVNRRSQLGCSDHSILNFTNEGVQHVNLGYDCLWTGGELAETVLSIVGVPSQHNSPDRDQYINVIDENIIPEKRYLFKKLTDNQWLFHDVKYDFASAGHFHHHKHSANGRATIELRDPNGDVFLEDNIRFTISDLKKIRMLYNHIVMKKENIVPECEKLFRKGDNFDKHPRITIDNLGLKPRKKPNKYLGLPEDDVPPANNEEPLSHENHDDKEHEDTNHVKDNKEEIDDPKPEEYTEYEDRSDEENNHEPSAARKKPKSHPTKGKHTTQISPIGISVRLSNRR